MINQKLKPCPFCGGVADFRIRLINASSGIWQVKAVCMACDVESPHGIISRDKFKCDKKYIEAAKVAAKRWNNRTE